LWFDETGTDVKHFANISVSLNKVLSVTGSSSGLTCSFAGGCNLEVQAEGLSTLLKNDTVNNFITVCEEKCEFVKNLSDSSKSVCKLPKMSTIYSNENYMIETEKEDLKFRRHFGNLADVPMVFDNNLLYTPRIWSNQPNCHVGGSFKSNHVGMISQVRYFVPELQNRHLWVDNLKF